MAIFNPTFAATGASVAPALQSNPFITGLVVVRANATTLVVTPGSARAFNNDSAGVLTNSVTINTAAIATATAPNACYPILPSIAGAANDTVFGLYMLWDQGGTLAGALNASPAFVIATANGFMPTDGQYSYNSWRRIANIPFAAGTNNTLPFLQTGTGNSRRVQLQNSISALSAGAATSLTEVNLTANDGFINPLYVESVNLNVSHTPAVAGGSVGVSHASSGTLYPAVVTADVVALRTTVPAIITSGYASDLSYSNLYYINSAAAGSTDLLVTGWTDNFALTVYNGTV